MGTVLDKRKEYRRLDMSKLQNRKIGTMSSEKALKDIIPIDWTEDVLNGKKKVIITKHSFVVISDENGKIEGIPYDFVANVMSSFKDNKQKEWKLKQYPGNFPIVLEDRVVKNDNGKSGYIKSDQLYYFQRDNIEFDIIGYLKPDILDLLLEFLEESDFDIIDVVDNLEK